MKQEKEDSDLKILKDKLERMEKTKEKLIKRKELINKINKLEQELKDINPTWFRKLFKLGRNEY